MQAHRSLFGRSVVTLWTLLAISVDLPRSVAQQSPDPTPDTTPAAASTLQAKPPWMRAGGTSSTKTPRRSVSARELLLNVEASQWEMLRDGRPLHADEEETLTRVLYRLPVIGPNDSFRLAKQVASWKEFPGELAPQRGDMVRFKGRVKRVTRVSLIPEIAARFQFNHYFAVNLQPTDESFQVLVYARQVPEAWSLDRELDEPAGVEAVYLKSTAVDAAVDRYLLAAERLAWFPDRADEQDRGDDAEQVPTDWVLLARLGMDIGRLDDIRKRDGLPLENADTACFYEMLTAAGQGTSADWALAPEFDLLPFLQKPQQQHGKLARVTGRVKRVTKIVLTNSEIHDRYGIDHYYEVDLMIPLGNREVRLPRNAQDKEAPVITNSFPVVCCVLDVPERLRALAENATVNEDMTITGFNFRLWSYQSAFLNDASRAPGATVTPEQQKARRRQPSPMFVAARAEFSPPAPRQEVDLGFYLGGALLVGLVVVGLVTFWTRRQDAKSRRRLRSFPPLPLTNDPATTSPTESRTATISAPAQDPHAPPDSSQTPSPR